MINRAMEGELKGFPISSKNKWSVCVVLASGGYPGEYEKGKVIEGLEEASSLPDVFIFHAGTKIEKGEVKTSGGRVLSVVGVGDNLSSAREKVYRAIELIHFEGMHMRRDIGHHA
jgi:phosphoribosylamine--glycine ligase